MAHNQTQPLTQTQPIGETQLCSDNDSDNKSPKKSDVWGKLFPISEYFLPIGKKVDYLNIQTCFLILNNFYRT